jgi:hypothetical protein
LERVAFLTAEWCASAGSILEPLPLEGWTGFVVELVVTEGPKSETRVAAALVPGAPPNLSPGSSSSAPPGPVVTLTLTRDDALAILFARLRLDTAYMQGRAKLAGDHGLVLRLLSASAGPTWEVCRSRLAAITDAES